MTSVTLAANTSTVNAYYGDQAAGNPTITAAVGGLASGSQQETINGGAASKLAITSAAFSGSVNASATNGFTATLEDAFGNPTTKTTATTVNLTSNSAGTHSFAATSGGTAVTSLSLPVNTSSVTAFYGDTKIGTPTITAAATGVTSGSQQETITAGVGTQLAITSTAFSATASVSATNAFTVTLEDSFGNPTSGGAISVNLNSNSAGSHSFAATSGGVAVTSVTLPSGSSSVTAFYSDTKVGTPTITASATGPSPVVQQETITAGAGTQLNITSNPFSGSASSSAINAFTVTLQDAFGNPATKTTATTVNLTSNSAGTHLFAATSGGAGVTSVSLPANTSSVTAFYGDQVAGTPTITAAATGVTSGTQQETITAGSASKLAITSTAFSSSAGSSTTNAFTVTLQDAFGNPATKTTATTVNLTSNSAGTHLFAATSGGAGVTSVSLPANTSSVTAFYGDQVAGTPTITAAATGVTSGTQQETITAGPASQLNITSNPFSGGANSSATNAFTVTLQDALGNATTKTTATTVNLTSNSSGIHSFATTSGGAAVTTVSLPANTSSVTAFYGDQLAGSPTITATAAGLTSATQQDTITGSTASKLVISSSAFSGSASASATNAFTVALQDSFGNATTKASATTVNLTSNSSGIHSFATTSGGAAVTTVSLPANTSSVTAFYGDQVVGTPTITAAATGLTSATQQETINAGAVAQLNFTTGTMTASASTSATMGPLTVQEQDAFGNTTRSALTVNLSSSSAGGKFAASSGGAAITSVNIAAGSSPPPSSTATPRRGFRFSRQLRPASPRTPRP